MTTQRFLRSLAIGLSALSLSLSLSLSLWQCNVLPGAQSGNCEVYFRYESIGQFVTRRGECTVTGNILKVTDSKTGKFTFNSTTGEYSRQEVDIYENRKGKITANDQFWIFYENEAIFARVTFDYLFRD